MVVTSTRLPPTFRTRSARIVVVVTTFNLGSVVGEGVGITEVAVGVGEEAGAAAPQATARITGTPVNRETSRAALGFLWSQKLEPMLVRPGISFQII
jgi:hypothetical protein